MLESNNKMKTNLYEIVLQRLKKSVSGTSYGNYKIKCKFCYVPFCGSYNIVKAHLLKMTGKGSSTMSKGNKWKTYKIEEDR